MLVKRSVLAGAILALGVSGGAQAAAWTQQQGQGQLIADVYHTNSKQGFNAAGNTVPITGYKKTEVNIYAEYGISDRFTSFFQTGLQSVDVKGVDSSDGLGYSEMGGRYKLFGPEGGAVSVQGSVRVPGRKGVKGPAQVGNSDTQFDLRAMWGQSFKLAGRDGFFNIEGGYRLRNGAPPNETHIDLTLGYRPVPKLLVLAQSFTTASDGAGTGVFTKYHYTNLKLGAAVDVTDDWTLQAAWVGTVDGKNALRERGFNLGAWRKF